MREFNKIINMRNMYVYVLDYVVYLLQDIKELTLICNYMLTWMYL
jgi:hypothetical protein